MNIYTYRDWDRGKRKLVSEEGTLLFYSRTMYLPAERAEEAKAAKKFLKTCTSTEEWVKYAYANDFPYCICKMNSGHVESYIRKEFRKDSISVSFLDEYERVFMFYVFNKQENGKYFCVGMMFWDFMEGKGGDDDDTKAWIYTFETNGNVEVIERETGATEECIWTSKRPLNVENNWEDAPEFGDWEGLLKMKRWQPGEFDEVFKGE
ncbi:hypothetical protein [Pedobacter nototheniae]|uniref:hypothetical protein n=1 Tax=Pedobacter nototheniae TaxID=2488994 RepID=UPI0010394F86|nr:hypothetical protein [Pedobacter nototheniae]